MISISLEKPTDVAAREALLDVAYGPVRFTKPSQRLRQGHEPALALVATEHSRLVGTVRLWPVVAGHGRPALLLGPLAVDPACRRRGIGAALMRRAIPAPPGAGPPALPLGGPAPYYGPLGSTAGET